MIKTTPLFPELKLGELLHDDMFGLFEAMSAIELMDPKMDAGMKCNRLKGRMDDQTGEFLGFVAQHNQLNECYSDKCR